MCFCFAQTFMCRYIPCNIIGWDLDTLLQCTPVVLSDAVPPPSAPLGAPLGVDISGRRLWPLGDPTMLSFFAGACRNLYHHTIINRFHSVLQGNCQDILSYTEFKIKHHQRKNRVWTPWLNVSCDHFWEWMIQSCKMSNLLHGPKHPNSFMIYFWG